MHRIKTITLVLPLRLGNVNCYLVEVNDGFFLIDTGGSNKRIQLERELDSAGCKPGNLHLIVVTHGDFDHTGNCAYLRDRYGARIVMHQDDLGMVECGDIFWNRNIGNAVFSKAASILFGFSRAERFRPDFFLEDGTDLSEYGLDARVLTIPGHSKGSIGILTANGDLFCGDLLENKDTPSLSSIVDDAPAANASLEKLKRLEITTVYPGHGEPFPMQLCLEIQPETNPKQG